jgi:hypothetical protein
VHLAVLFSRLVALLGESPDYQQGPTLKQCRSGHLSAERVAFIGYSVAQVPAKGNSTRSFVILTASQTSSPRSHRISWQVLPAVLPSFCLSKLPIQARGSIYDGRHHNTEPRCETYTTQLTPRTKQREMVSRLTPAANRELQSR